ncbi:hypothetical protein GCM10011519_04710 [Marmoricola endophyticus]|uniref:phospholipase D n=1 Tax=Marmoricola endophyticus TaxID=2040280 RepID=A0A917BCP0_9ACTN|nr:phospholipase D-like domain-containing protein [Marmoricola endophyticus]GGF34292.1 hypothetical protein GCM10011519_04710 [Marmoricola endophyticus]
MTAHGFRPLRTWTAALVLALTTGGLTSAGAYADDTPSPSPTPTEQTQPASPSPTPSDEASDPVSGQVGAAGISVSSITASPTSLLTGQVTTYTTTAKNTGSTTLTGLRAVHDRTDYRSGWCVATTLSPGQQTVCHAVTRASMADLAAGGVPSHSMTVVAADGTKAYDYTPKVPVSRDCSNNAPQAYTPMDTSWFNYPYGSAESRNNIRLMVIRTINSVPQCQSIRMAVYSLNDNATVDALIAAAKRGVSVNVITDGHNVRGDKATQSPSFKRLMATIGSSTARASWAKVCSASCRGTGGNHHDKLYLFSQAGTKQWVSMAGSANLTIKASSGQWNHLDTYTSAATFSYYNDVFTQLRADRPAATPYVDRTTDGVRTWFFPKPGASAATDPMMTALASIGCTGSSYNGGRTIVRIGMYAWYEDRGLWLAKRVRALWNAGCDIAVEYAIMGNNVKQILYSPAGRGRIPMRQVATYYKDGSVANYDHQKYVTMIGRYGSNPSSAITWTGTTNWSNFGFSSDELTQVWSGATRAAIYRTAFANVWRGPHTRVPSPTSKLGVKIDLGGPNFRGFENN